MNPNPRLLIVEDERALAVALAAAVRRAGAGSELAPTAAQARRKLAAANPAFDGMVLDLGLPDENGLSFLGSLPESERPPVLLVTAHGEIDNAIAARKLGVREFFAKPLDFEAFNRAVAGLLTPRGSAGDASAHASAESEGEGDESAFIGAAPAMRAVFRRIAHACAGIEPVTIRGATGTGKSHVARLIRRNGPRRGKAAAVFAAGGGRSDDGGELAAAFEAARGGTLIVEEVAALSPGQQAFLARALETEEADAPDLPRILATSTADPREAVVRGVFRSDLYYRLQVLEIRLPRLRDRLEDLPALVALFARQLAPGRRVEAGDGVLKRLAAHDWPGNLRELRNTVAAAIAASAGAPVMGPEHLPEPLGGGRAAKGGSLPEDLSFALAGWVGERLDDDPPPAYRDLSETLERELIRELLKRFDGKLARLATELKANRATLRRRLRGG